MLLRQKKMTKKEEIKRITNQLRMIEDKESIILVVEIRRKVMGCADVTKEKNPSKKHTANLGISLKKEIRGKGIGKRLLKTVLKEAKKVLKVKIIKLSVMAPNKIAQNLYKKLGFKEIGRIKKGLRFYQKYVDEVIMTKHF